MKLKQYRLLDNKQKLWRVLILCFFVVPLFSFFNKSNLEEKFNSNKQFIDEGLVYYSFEPKNNLRPILVVVEGSYVHQEGPQSIIRLHKPFSKLISELDYGLILIERRGISNESVYKDTFHKFNTPTQRLHDHIKLVNYLKENPPSWWNGEIFILGGSEGGPIAIKLAKNINANGLVAIVGCGDQTFKEYIWQVIEKMYFSSSWSDKLIFWWEDLPKNRAEYEDKCEEMKKNPTPNKWWFGQTYLYWSDALDQEEKDDFLALKCPSLVISGSEDVGVESTNSLIEKAISKKMDITYFCIEGMGHNAMNPEFQVIDKVLLFLRKNE
ncbi:MAG: hypothetical protein K940chlam5_01026 [Candidatus Anoxychlamydiales bacterium]|nr:hypothetical protein [Candidatus Anoxychlamydiales bacterium]